ncbi:hypothetical protein [Leifsonia sp. AG29]|uniref:hypothetical protein n=1 Tax=Leifsonia sp. AG29 TaxID=2598860 RepID=UPI00131B1C84|nr:hypothetical protein [Leifsonia sp. AG29]
MRARMRVIAIALAALAAVSTLVAVDGRDAPPADAASASDFSAGYLVSDQNFYNGSAMTASDVQSFLVSKNSVCRSTYACLYSYTQATPSMSGDAYCAPFSGMASESAASIIARVGAACGISQKALVVLLEKEQGLVTSSAPTQGAFLHATGFSCPDTAPCNPAYGGFFYQLYYGARQFQVYRARPTSFNYQPNAWNRILYNPNSACGSSSVYIQGYATAGLYDYTPYQPNAAALANLYGTGDSCSTYGNRNFWRLWSDWFGSPTQSGSLIRLSGTSAVYLTSGNRRYVFPSSDLLAQYSTMGAVTDLTQAQFNSYQDAGAPVQRAIRVSDGSVFLVDQGRRYRFRDCGQAASFGYDCTTLPVITAAQIVQLNDGGPLTDLVKLPDASVWFMQSGTRRQTPDASVLAPYGVPATTTSLSNSALASTPVGPPVVGAGVFTDGQGNYTASTFGGAYSISAAAAAGGVATRAVPLQPASFQRLSPSGPLPLRLASSSRFFIAVDGGWLEVDGTTFGTSTFTSLPANSWTGVPLVGTAKSALFIKERSNAQVYLISGGVKQTVADQSALTWISLTFGVPPTVWNAADGALRGVNPPAGTIVGIAGTQTVYLLDGTNRYQFRDCTQVANYGSACGKVPTTTLGALSDYSAAGTLTDLVKLPDGTIWLMQGGQRRETPDPSVLALYWIPTTTTSLSAGAISGAPIGLPVTPAGVYTNGSGTYVAATQGGAFIVSPPAAAGKVGAGATRLQPQSLQNMGASVTLPLRLTSDGRSFVSVDEGWLEVNPANFGGAGAFTPLGTKTWTGVPLAGTNMAPLFMRERASSQIYLISGGYKQPVADQSAVNWLAAYYGLSPRVWVATTGALTGLLG